MRLPYQRQHWGHLLQLRLVWGTIAKAPRAAQRVVKGLIDAVQPPPGSVMPQANEMLPIFHGTSPESAKAIQQSGF